MLTREVPVTDLQIGQHILDNGKRRWEIASVAVFAVHVDVYLIARDDIQRPGIGLLTEKGKGVGSALKVRVPGLDNFEVFSEKSKETRLKIHCLRSHKMHVIVNLVLACARQV